MTPAGHHNTTSTTAALLLAAAVAWLVLAAPWLLGDVTIPYDAKAHFHPQLAFLARALHTAQSPFWAPQVFAGSPQIADPQSLIFSPAVALALATPDVAIKALDWYALALLGLAGLAAIAIFLDRGWHPAGALVAGLGITFGASAAWRIQHIGQIQSYALFVVALWALMRALDRRSPLYAVLAGLAIGLMIAQPDQVAFLAGLVLVAYAVFRVIGAGVRWPGLARYLPVLACVAVIALVVAIVPVTLTYLFAAASSRAEIPFGEVIRGSLHPVSLLTGAIGDLYGAHDPAVHYWGPYSMAWNPDELTLSQNMSQIYVGALPALLILTLGFAGGQLWHRDIRFFAATLLVMVLYALGGFTPVFRFFYEVVPGVRMFRRPADATFIIGACLAIVGGYLMHRLATGDMAPLDRGRLVRLALPIAIVLVAAVIVALMAGHFAEARRPILIATACLAAALGVAWFVHHFALRRPFACLALIAVFSIIDLSVNNGPNESTALPLRNYKMLRADTRDEVITFLKSKLAESPTPDRRDRVELVGLGFSWPNLGLVHGFDHVLGYNPLRLEAATRVIGAGDTIAGWDQRRFTPLFPSYGSLLARLLGLRYVVTPVPIERIDKRLRPGDLRLLHRTSRAYIYENVAALPRAAFVPGWQRADFTRLTATGTWPAFDPARTVLLERPPPVSPALAPTARPAQTATGSHIAIVRYENTVVEIVVTAATPGFVVLYDMWHPWWRATVEDRSAPLLKANVMFRAVQVPAGRHTVRFEFQPIAGAMAEIVPELLGPAQAKGHRDGSASPAR